MFFLYALILGLVEGITEFLPISSTGHLILVSNLLRMPATEFWKSFEIAIQSGAILAVVVLYWKKIWDVKNVWPKLLVAFLPTAVIGLALYKIVKHYLLGNSLVVLAAMLVGGAVIILFERYYARRLSFRTPVAVGEKSLSTTTTDGDSSSARASVGMTVNDFTDLNFRQAFFVGLFQSIAIIPGVSRSAATIIGGLALGLSRPLIIEFSFLLAVPTMAAATGLDLLKSGFNFSASEWGIMAVGFITAFLTAIVAIKWLLRYISKRNFSVFGWYRVSLAVLWTLLLILM